MKKSLLAAAIASTMVFAVGAEAASVKVSGQVSRMVVLPDDAAGDDAQFVDIGWSGSRFRLTGDKDLGNGHKIGFRLEEQLRSNAVQKADGGLEGNVADEDGQDNRDNRYQDIWVSGSYGKVAMGKGDGAANGTTESDLSGTALSSGSNHQDNWGNFKISDGGLAFKSVFKMFDGQSRTNRVRYDSPNFSGFSIAASTGQGGHNEIAARYKGTVSGLKVKAGLGFVDQKNVSGSEAEIVSASVSVLLGGGFNVTVAASESEPQKTGSDQESYTVKLGYKKGIHAFAVDYGEGETDNATNDEGETWGLTYAAAPIKGVEFFVTYRELDGDRDGVSTESAELFAVGSRVRF